MVKLQVLPEPQLSLQVMGQITKAGEPVILPVHIAQNGTYYAGADKASGYNPVTVDVDMTPAKEEGYLNGYEAGAKEGAEVGYANGKQAEYDRFWDVYQDGGKRTDYERGFFGVGWTDDNFKPKYPVVLTGDSYNLFDRSKVSYIDESLVDCSGATLLQYFLSSNNSGKPVTAIMDISSCIRLTNTFIYSANVETVELKNIREDCEFSNTFLGCAIVNFRCTGTIGKNFNMSSNRLSDASIQNIIDHLKDLTGASAHTLTFHADVGAKLTPEQKAAITAKNWTLVY